MGDRQAGHVAPWRSRPAWSKAHVPSSIRGMGENGKTVVICSFKEFAYQLEAATKSAPNAVSAFFLIGVSLLRRM